MSSDRLTSTKIAYTKDASPNALFDVWERESLWHAGVAICSNMLRASWVVFLGGSPDSMRRFTVESTRRFTVESTFLTHCTQSMPCAGKPLIWKICVSVLLLVLPSEFQEQSHIHVELIISSPALWGFTVMSQKLMTNFTVLLTMSPESNPGPTVSSAAFNFSREILPLRPIPLSYDSSKYCISLF